jgi:hypothetical protein
MWPSRHTPIGWWSYQHPHRDTLTTSYAMWHHYHAICCAEGLLIRVSKLKIGLMTSTTLHRISEHTCGTGYQHDAPRKWESLFTSPSRPKSTFLSHFSYHVFQCQQQQTSGPSVAPSNSCSLSGVNFSACPSGANPVDRLGRLTESIHLGGDLINRHDSGVIWSLIWINQCHF